MPADAYPMIRNAILREIVSADFFGTHSKTDLAFARGSFFFHFFFQPLGENSGAQNFHGSFAVLPLAAFILAGDYDAGRKMNNANRGISGIDALPAGSARS